MAPKINPLTKIIGLSGLLAAGFLMIVLAGAIYGNWLPILISISFAISYLPIPISQNLGQYSSSSTDFMDDSTSQLSDFCKFLSLVLTTTSVATPIILKHCHILTHAAMYLTLIGGSLIFTTVVIFTSFFDVGDDSELDFDI